MAEHGPDGPDGDGRFVRLDDGDLYVVEDGPPDAPAVLLIHGTGACTAWWDPVIPQLAGTRRVIRVDLAGHGRSASPAGGYDIPAQARRVGAVLERLATLGLQVLVIFGTDDKRWRSSSAAAYRDVPGARVELLPGVGHTPMLEDPQTTGTLLLRFALAMKEENRVCPR